MGGVGEVKIKSASIIACALYRCALITAAALLASCAATTPRVETVRVLIPQPIPCVAVADVPVRPAPLPKDRPASDRDAVRALLAALLAWAGPGGYGDRAAAVFTGCQR